MAQETTADEGADRLSPPQRMLYEHIILAYKVTVMQMPRKSGKTTITKLLVKKMRELDESTHLP